MSSSSPRGLSAERLSLYAGLAMGTGLVAAANADVISSTGGIVAQATVDTTMNGATYNSTGPSSGYWQLDQKRVHDTFTMAGVTMQIEAFNLRTNGSPRLIGGKMNGTGFQAMATGYAYGGAWASKLASGAMIGTANQSFGSFSFYGVRGFGQRADGGSASYQSANFNNDPANWSPIFNAPFEGEFIDATGESRGFAGIRLTGAGGVGVDFYGWLDIGFDHTTGTLTVYAWGYDDSGAPIIAGQTGGGGAVPGLGGLAALACGAAGVRGRRHRVA
jgi:hypothetical protein